MKRFENLGAEAWLMAAVLLFGGSTGCGGPAADSEATPVTEEAGAVAAEASPKAGQSGATPAEAVGEADEVSAAPAKSAPRAIPAALKRCAGCHFAVIQSYLGHGMSRSVGKVGGTSGLPAAGEVTNPRTGVRYTLSREGETAWLTAVRPDGGLRRQRIVGRVGGGVLDTSWVTEDVDSRTGRPSGRLYFAPVETIEGLGLALSPFELHDGSPGPDMGLTQDCLTCHTADRVFDLPGAAAAANRRSVFPGNVLGSDAFEELGAIGCDGCHGDTSRHAALAIGEAKPGPGEGLGIVRLRELSTGQVRDVCARCHLQGEARFELRTEAPERSRPLGGQIPVLVPARPVEAFRFVGQVEQLSRSLCFVKSPQMTCVTCHDPHTTVAEQGTASFEAACAACHSHCSRPPDLRVEQVTGRPPRGEAGCVDCHVRRDQPLDLPHIEAVDHRVRRRLPERQPPAPHSAYLDPQGSLAVYDEGRLTKALSTPDGRRWRDGVVAMGLVSLRRIPEALELFGEFPPPGTADARRPTAPEGLTPLETAPLFHHMRALALQASGRFEAALSAYGDALELDPQRAGARMGRARLRLDTGDLTGVVADTDVVIAAHPQAEAPWSLRAELALRLGRLDMAEKALTTSAEIRPASAAVWYQLTQVRRLLGFQDLAREAQLRAEELQPTPPRRPATQ